MKKLLERMVRHETLVTPVAAIVVAAVLAFTGLTNHAFWDDEANTGIFARNLLEFGELTAWDGTNLIGFRTGAELSDELVNTYMPPLQYYYAAIGIFLFGETSFGGRVMFVLAGLAGLGFMALFCRRFLDDRFAINSAPLLLALSPAYLLYIRNCRYYALSALLMMAAFAAFSSSMETPRGKKVSFAVALVAVLLLPFNHYMNAAGLLASLPIFFFFKEYRTKRHAALLGAIYAVSAAVAGYILITANPFGSAVSKVDTTPPVDRFLELLLMHLRDLGPFEFIPVTLIPVLLVPLLVPALKDYRGPALKGLALVAIVLVNAGVVALFTPQPLGRSNVGDMRHLVPMICIGSAIGAAAIAILWRLARFLAPVVVSVLVFTNVLHLGFMGEPSLFMPPRGPNCTLCQYVGEQLNDYHTSTEWLIEYLDNAADGTVVLVYPPYMAYSPMYYHPDLKFCCQLDRDKEVTPELAATLPDYLYWEKAEVSLALISSSPPPRRSGPLDITYRKKKYRMGTYHLYGDDFYLDVFREDRSRPEIPWHSFSVDEFEGVPHKGFFVAEITR